MWEVTESALIVLVRIDACCKSLLLIVAGILSLPRIVQVAAARGRCLLLMLTYAYHQLYQINLHLKATIIIIYFHAASIYIICHLVLYKAQVG